MTGGQKTLYASSPLLDTSSATSLQAQDLAPSTLMRKYQARNISTHATGEYVWSRAAPKAADPGASFPAFNLTATIRIPITKVSYTPDVSEVLKYAWIQYLSMLVVTGFLLDRLCAFVYYHQVGREGGRKGRLAGAVSV